MGINERLSKLEREAATAGTGKDVYFFDDGSGLTDDEAAEAAAAEARGDTVTVFYWGAPSDGN